MPKKSTETASTDRQELSGPLEIGPLLRALTDDGVISASDSRRVPLTPGREGERTLHVLNHIARCELPDCRRNGATLNIDTLLDWLSDRFEQDFFHIDPLKIDVSAITEVMSFAFAKRHGIMAVEVSDSTLRIASAEPGVSGWEKDLQQADQRRIDRVIADPEDIARYTVEFYSLDRSVRGASGNKSSEITNLEQLLEMREAADLDANDGPVVRIVDWLLQYAFDQRASDIHIEPRREQGHVRFRIDGVLYTVYDMPAAVMAAVVARLKILGRMNVAEKRRPQDGRIKTRAPDGGEVELRLSTLPTAFGEKLVMRIFDPEVLLRGFEDLGLRGDDLGRWESMMKQPNGIVLVTGPTGSGKTTTLYSTLKRLATSEVNVCTIEDPIEMVEPSFNQMQVQHQIDLDFASGVRALLRQDPDIIMIGEIRDLETAEMAIQAALTGHLVLSTLHTNDAPSALTRMLELGVPAYLIRATLLGVMAQRLVRTLCPHCKQPAEPDLDSWNALTAPWRATPPSAMKSAPGCLECRNTGFLGREGIYEILDCSDEVKDLIGADLSVQAIRKAAVKQGMKTLRMSGARMVANGRTTIGEVLRVAPPSHGDRH